MFRRLFLPARPHPLLFVCVCCWFNVHHPWQCLIQRCFNPLSTSSSSTRPLHPRREKTTPQRCRPRNSSTRSARSLWTPRSMETAITSTTPLASPSSSASPTTMAATLSLTSTLATLSVFQPSVVTSSPVFTSRQPLSSPTRHLLDSVLSH